MVAVYARQSIEKRDSISIESQIQKCLARLEQGEECRIYRDSGYSGGNTARPAFQELMRDVEEGRVHRVIVYKLDRFSRSLLDFANIQQKMDRHHVGFVSCSETIDTSTPQGRAMLNMTMTFAQFERETIQERIRDNYYARGRQGFYLGGPAPFGYLKVPAVHQGKSTSTFAEHPQQGEIVRRMFADYGGSDLSLGGLAAGLTDRGIRTNTGCHWGSVSLGRLLRNPVYVQADAEVYRYLHGKGAVMNNAVSEYIGENGCYVYANRKETTVSKFNDLSQSYVTLALHKGLVSGDLWLRCQRKLDRNRQVKNSGKGTHSWLSGLMKCGECGMAISVVRNSRGSSYLNCGGRKQQFCRGPVRGCRLDVIEEAVKEQLFYRVQLLDSDSLALDKPPDTRVNSLKIQLVQVEEQIGRIVGQVAGGTATVQHLLNQHVEKLEAQRRQLEEALLHLEEETQPLPGRDFQPSQVIADWEAYPFGVKKRLAHIFIRQVTLTDNTIRVDFY